MSIERNKTWLFRIIPIQNLEFNLLNGLYCKKAGIVDPSYVSIGSQEIISRRDTIDVKCYPDTKVNDYVPFYFSVRTPMLYNIYTGMGVPAKPQEEIIYLCCKLTDLASETFQWCYTDGNAANAITRFYNDLKDLEQLDWHSITTTDFRTNNVDGDEDRLRKKHSEFLVLNHVPTKYIKAIIVKNSKIASQVNAILAKLALKIPVHTNPNQEFYF
ncbi:MAG: DUF4433 domain-containing protein [Lewinellaceae bacterium]|nr:DUF4433 domain-containing protein [Lewinellaceae bacterium]